MRWYFDTAKLLFDTAPYGQESHSDLYIIVNKDLEIYDNETKWFICVDIFKYYHYQLKHSGSGCWNSTYVLKHKMYAFFLFELLNPV